MPTQVKNNILAELEQLPLIDPHTHINPHSAASTTLADIMGYHYYTELAHSAGLPQDRIEEPGLAPKEKVGRLVERLGDLDNTTQLGWLIEIAHEFFGFQEEKITSQNWEKLYDNALSKMSEPDWEQQVLKKSQLEQVYLTNEFDDPLSGFDTSLYVPCLRTDDLVFHYTNPQTRTRLARATDVEINNAAALTKAIGKLFSHFTAHNARACAISLPPTFSPRKVSPAAIDPLLAALGKNQSLSGDEANLLSCFIFWSLAEHCSEFKLPFDLMIGVNRRVYEAGVFQGQDLYDSRTSLYLYKELFNAFPNVTFPVSVLAPTSNQELVSYSWIFPNVVTNGHWWYSNIPVHIETDCRTRLQAVPQSKQIGYYSDMYKLEFALPKFAMYKRVLAKVLANDFVIDRGWSEERAISLGKTVLRGNVERIFGGL